MEAVQLLQWGEKLKEEAKPPPHLVQISRIGLRLVR